MPFIPHTASEVSEMLRAVGAPNIDALFSEIPAELRCEGLSKVPPGLSEMEVTRLMESRAAQDGRLLNFVGAGAYEHHIPAAVWELTTRGEFYSAYTPYQAEASQGTLQLLYEFQTMMCELTGMEVSNASLYDGASALAEAMLMAVRANAGASGKRVLLPATVHPYYRQVAHALTRAQGLELVLLPYDRERGSIEHSVLQSAPGDCCAVVIPQPNFFGVLEEVDALCDWAHAQGALVIALVNPVSLGLLKPPSQWGSTGGADIVCGEGQPMGAPLSSGGPYFGFLTTRQALVRQMPGRIIGRTVDEDGRPGYTLTLQAREQHIRRSKATSNICTNQGLVVTAATIHMSLLGAEGLARVAGHCLANLQRLRAALSEIPGVRTVFQAPTFHEAVIGLPQPADAVLCRLAEDGILGGFDLRAHYPELGPAILTCATETKLDADIQRFADSLRRALVH